MDIVKENTDALNAVLKLHVTKEDYGEKVENVLKDYRKKANIPGFRPGKVPMGMIKKMYYKPVLAEELNKVVLDSMFKYIYDEKIEILGEPLPVEKEEAPIDFDKDTEFDFSFDIGLAPKIDLNISNKDKIPYYKIKVTDEDIHKSVENIAQRFGSFKSVEKVEENTFLKGEIIQVDANDQPVEEGMSNVEASVSVQIIKDEKIKKAFIGKVKGDVVIFDLKKAFPNDTEIAALLGIEKEQAIDVSGNFQLTIKEITFYEKAPVDQGLFDKAYGEGAVKSEDEFKAKIAEEMASMYESDSNYKFNLDAKDHFVKKYKPELPVEFLKRWLLKANSEKYTAEDIDKDFASFETDLKWQLLSNMIKKENNIEVSEDEALNQAKQMVAMQYRQYGMNNIPEDILTNSANQILQNDKEKRRVYDMVSDQKVFNYLKENVKLDEKVVTPEKFNKMFEENK